MLGPDDREFFFKLATKLTGAIKSNDRSLETLVANVERRMAHLQIASFVEYLRVAEQSPEELAELVSLLTIHTTAWFREAPHFVAFQEILLKAVEKKETFKVWCAACSTGEEVYSFALLLEEFRRVHPSFDYRVLGTDIDRLSLRVGERAIYQSKDMGFHVNRYKEHTLLGSGPTEGFFTLSKPIRERCTFRQHDLRLVQTPAGGPFHLIVCRNVLIYFNYETTTGVLANLLLGLHPDGHLMLGHSENINALSFGLQHLGHSLYQLRTATSSTREFTSHKPRVLSIDPSATSRKVLKKVFEEIGFELISVATPTDATTHMNFNDVDLVTIELNSRNGEAEKWLTSEQREGLPVPVVIISESQMSDPASIVSGLACGAQEFIEKTRLMENPSQFREKLLKIVSRHKESLKHTLEGGLHPTVRPDVILIGASTGGPQALALLLDQMPLNCPPVVITQHISPQFATPLAERLAESSGLKLGEVAEGAKVLPGHLYMARGDYHLGVKEENGQLKITLSNAPSFNGHRPSVDFLFNSAIGLRSRIAAILLTGMGRDGALGLRFLNKEGAYCVAQSERDCVVYGMPKEAIERGAAHFVGTIAEIKKVLLESFMLGSRNTKIV